METYGKILLIAMPVFLALVLLEKWWGWFRGRDTVRHLDTISSLSSGVTNVTKDVLGLSIAIISYEWMVQHFAVVHVPYSPLLYLIAFMALDFSGYWVHRLDHEYNFLWNAHIIHHSSEDFNLACALRQNISIALRLFTIFLLPAALLGVPGNVIAVVAPLHLFAQFWYHTQHIGRMGFLEKIIVTPSHHRVHHAINKEYLDKNYGQIFIFWDKLFGTYQEELSEVTPVYGITRPAHTWNPIRINFMHLWLLVQDAWHASHMRDKLRIWFMPTGWRPADVAERYPVYKIEDVHRYAKYDTGGSAAFIAWAWVQLTVLLLLVSYLFGNIASIGSPGMFIYGGFIFLYVYAFTELMDKHPFAWTWQLGCSIAGIGIIVYQGDWFAINRFFAAGNYVFAGYFLLMFFLSLWFLQKERRIAAVPA